MNDWEDLDAESFADAVSPRHRFGPVVFRGTAWDLNHLAPFGFRAEIDGGGGGTLSIDVVVFFSCHCFTNGDAVDQAPPSEIYRDGHEVRVLCEERYALSRQFLPRLIRELRTRHIRVASDRSTYLTFEVVEGALAGFYTVFFEVSRDRYRKKRLLLRVQSAYRMDRLTRQLEKAGKINFGVLLEKAYKPKSK